MKTVYLVRHGETEGNVAGTMQGAADALTELGKDQVKIVSHRLKALPFSKIVSSDLTRTRETTEIILKDNDVPVEYSDLFREFVGPTAFEGVPYTEIPEEYRLQKQGHCNDPAWHYSDEENYTEQLERVRRAMAYIEELPEDDVLVVTHGLFIKFFSIALLLGEECGPCSLASVARTFKTINTGITVVHFFEDGHKHILSWNDHSHFADE